DLRAAMLASVGPTLGNPVELGVLAALFALVALAEADQLKMLQAAFLGREAVLKLTERGCFDLCHVHYLAHWLTCRKGIIPRCPTCSFYVPHFRMERLRATSPHVSRRMGTPAP